MVSLDLLSMDLQVECYSYIILNKYRATRVPYN